MERVTVAQYRALVETAALGDISHRFKAKRELVQALQAIGYARGQARQMVQAWTAERRRELRAGSD